MNKLLTLVDKGVNKGYFGWLWIAGAISWWAFMVFVVIANFWHHRTSKILLMYDEDTSSWVEKHEGVDIVASVKDVLTPYMIAWYAFMILTPFLVKWIVMALFGYTPRWLKN